MGRSKDFRRTGKVSVWVGAAKPDPKVEVDVLRDWCGVDYYDLDDQEVSALKKFARGSVETVLRQLSYSASFVDAALAAANRKGVSEAYWALAQYDFAYNPKSVTRPVAADPVFLGAFDWNDAE